MSVFLILVMVCSIVACGKTSEQNDPSESLPTESDTQNVEIDETANLKLKDEKMLWEKDFCLLKSNALTLDAKWDEYIYVGGDKVYSKYPTDISVVPNYLFDDNASIADLNAAYNNPHVDFSIDTTKCYFDEYASGTLTFYGTTYKEEEKFVVETVRFSTEINPFEGGLDTLVNTASYTEGAWGIGSRYGIVKAIIGEGEENALFNQDNLHISDIFYSGENAGMVLTIQWFEDEGVDSAVITDIEWTAGAVLGITRNQENLELFDGFEEAYGVVLNEEDKVIKNNDGPLSEEDAAKLAEMEENSTDETTANQ